MPANTPPLEGGGAARNRRLSLLFEQFGEIPPFVQYAGDLNSITLNAIEDYVGLAEHGPQAGRHFVARRHISA
jgi:hypothetical protein